MHLVDSLHRKNSIINWQSGDQLSAKYLHDTFWNPSRNISNVSMPKYLITIDPNFSKRSMPLHGDLNKNWLWHENNGKVFFSLYHPLCSLFTVHLLLHHIFVSAEKENDNYSTYQFASISRVCNLAFPDILLTTTFELFWLFVGLIGIVIWDSSRLSILLFTCEGFCRICRSSILHSRWLESDYKKAVTQKPPEIFSVSVPQLTLLAHKI